MQRIMLSAFNVYWLWKRCFLAFLSSSLRQFCSSCRWLCTQLWRRISQKEYITSLTFALNGTSSSWMHRSQQAWGRSSRICIMITTATTKQKSRGRKSTLHDESCLVLHDQLWTDLAALRRCSVAVWFGMISKIEPEEGAKHGLHLSLYSQPS